MIHSVRQGCFKITSNMFDLTFSIEMKYPIKVEYLERYTKEGFQILQILPRDKFINSRYYAVGKYNNRRDADMALLLAQGITAQIKLEEASDKVKHIASKMENVSVNNKLQLQRELFHLLKQIKI